MKQWRRFALAAMLQLVVAVGVTDAQTVVVTKAKAGSTIELALNGSKLGSAIADADGVASLDVNLPAQGGKDQTDVRLAVDSCPTVLLVQLSESGVEPPPPGADCTRKSIAGVYLMRRVTTFVLDVSQPAPAVWLTQGPAPPSWLSPQGPGGPGGERAWSPLPKGLVVAAGGGLASFADAIGVACGNVTDCTGRGKRANFNGAATIWLTRVLAAEVSYLQAADVTASGSGDNYHFTSALQTKVLTIAAKVGIPAGPARVYGLGGAAYHWAMSTISETTDNSTVTVDGVETTIPGSTQRFGVSAPSWGWLAGGGVEIWVRPRVAIYGEAGIAPLKGADKDGGEARIDDHLTYIVAGVQIHVSR